MKLDKSSEPLTSSRLTVKLESEEVTSIRNDFQIRYANRIKGCFCQRYGYSKLILPHHFED